MKLVEMGKYVSTRLQKSSDTTQKLAFHISACQTITDTLGSEFKALQIIEKSMLDCKDRKECLSYIERNIGITIITIIFIFIFIFNNDKIKK